MYSAVIKLMIDFKHMHKFNYPFSLRKIVPDACVFQRFLLLKSNFLEKTNLQKSMSSKKYVFKKCMFSNLILLTKFGDIGKSKTQRYFKDYTKQLF